MRKVTKFKLVMNEINTHLHKFNNNSFDGIDTLQKDKGQKINSAFIKHQLHEKKIDEFFWTDLETPKKRFSALSLVGSFIGVITPLLIFGQKQQPKLKLDSLKNIYKATNIEYGLKELLYLGCGGVLGGLAGGLADRKESGKLEKLEEASFQLMNISFPAIFVNGGIKLCEKYKQLNHPGIKLIVSGIGMLAGVNLAVKGSNKLDDVYFDKHQIDPKRKFKQRDLIVHIDDLIGSLVLAKIPFADKIHAEKILPLIYTWSGYHVGEN